MNLENTIVQYDNNIDIHHLKVFLFRFNNGYHPEDLIILREHIMTCVNQIIHARLKKISCKPQTIIRDNLAPCMQNCF